MRATASPSGGRKNSSISFSAPTGSTRPTGSGGSSGSVAVAGGTEVSTVVPGSRTSGRDRSSAVSKPNEPSAARASLNRSSRSSRSPSWARASRMLVPQSSYTTNISTTIPVVISTRPAKPRTTAIRGSGRAGCGEGSSAEDAST